MQAFRDVVEARVATTIQPGVEEAERGLAGRKPVITKQRDYARHDLCIGGQSDARARQ